MPDTTLSTSGVTAQFMKCILWAPLPVGGHLQAFNPTTGLFANVSGSWASYLITVPEPDLLGVYILDVSTLSPALPAGTRVNPKFYNASTAGAQPFAEFPTMFWDGTNLALSSVNATLINGQVPVPETSADFEDIDIATTVTRSG